MCGAWKHADICMLEPDLPAEDDNRRLHEGAGTDRSARDPSFRFLDNRVKTLRNENIRAFGHEHSQKHGCLAPNTEDVRLADLPGTSA